MEGIGPTLPLPGTSSPAADGGNAAASASRVFPAVFPLAALPVPMPAGQASFAAGAGEPGKSSPPDGKPLPQESTPAPWVPPLLSLVPIAVPPAIPAAPGSLGAGQTAGGEAEARPGRGPEVAVAVRDGALPTQVLARLAQKSGPPGQAPPGDAPAVPPPVAEAKPPSAPLPGEPPLPAPVLPRLPFGEIPIDDPVTDSLSRPAPPDDPVATPSGRPGPPSGAARPGLVTGAVAAPPAAEGAGATPAPAPVSLPEGGPDTPAEPADVRPPQQAPAGAYAATPAPREPAPQAVMQLAVPAGSESFPQALGERVAWMIDRDVGSAQLRLNPPQLGPVEVRVQVSGDQASVTLAAHTQQAREALEQAMPRLRDMLGSQGFVQVNVNVSQHSFSERPARTEPWELPTLADPGPEALVAGPAAVRPRSLVALLDAYA